MYSVSVSWTKLPQSLVPETLEFYGMRKQGPTHSRDRLLELGLSPSNSGQYNQSLVFSLPLPMRWNEWWSRTVPFRVSTFWGTHEVLGEETLGILISKLFACQGFLFCNKTKWQNELPHRTGFWKWFLATLKRRKMNPIKHWICQSTNYVEDKIMKLQLVISNVKSIQNIQKLIFCVLEIRVTLGILEC